MKIYFFNCLECKRRRPEKERVHPEAICRRCYNRLKHSEDREYEDERRRNAQRQADERE